eukprot:SAG22_NODE_22692_length_191_cov_56.021739_1_plen_27_part_01
MVSLHEQGVHLNAHNNLPSMPGKTLAN